MSDLLIDIQLILDDYVFFLGFLDFRMPELQDCEGKLMKPSFCAYGESSLQNDGKWALRVHSQQATLIPTHPSSYVYTSTR